jgi:hypothetical protein
MSENRTAQKDNKLVIKLVGSPARIFEFVSELTKTKHDSLTISKIHKNEEDDGFHLFATIYFAEAPPKEHADVKVTEVH